MSDATRFHTGWLLDRHDRETLLERFPPRYPEVVAHHVTLKFGDRAAEPPSETAGEVVGVADDGRGVEALVVRISGTTDRPDGSTYHITWSLGPGRSARESNDLLRDGDWENISAPITIELEPARF